MYKELPVVAPPSSAFINARACLQTNASEHKELLPSCQTMRLQAINLGDMPCSSDRISLSFSGKIDGEDDAGCGG
jgi:hypothetical protein